MPTENWTGIPAGSQWDDLIPVGCCHFSGTEIHPSGMEIHPSGIPVITYRDFQVHFPVGSHLNSILDWTYFCWLLFFPFSQLAFFFRVWARKMFYKPFDHGEKRQTEAWPWSNMVSVFNRGWPFDHGRLWSTMLLSHTFILSPFNKNYIFFFKVPKNTFKINVSKVIYHSYYKNRKIYELVWHNKKFIITTKY